MLITVVESLTKENEFSERNLKIHTWMKKYYKRCPYFGVKRLKTLVTFFKVYKPDLSSFISYHI